MFTSFGIQESRWCALHSATISSSAKWNTLFLFANGIQLSFMFHYIFYIECIFVFGKITFTQQWCCYTDATDCGGGEEVEFYTHPRKYTDTTNVYIFLFLCYKNGQDVDASHRTYFFFLFFHFKHCFHKQNMYNTDHVRERKTKQKYCRTNGEKKRENYP